MIRGTPMDGGAREYAHGRASNEKECNLNAGYGLPCVISIDLNSYFHFNILLLVVNGYDNIATRIF